jgi:drug/metabolite transporter (DMT)-like permease
MSIEQANNTHRSTWRDYLQIHAVVLVWSLTAIVGKLITLPALDVVVWRTGIAALGYYIIAKAMRCSMEVERTSMLRLLGVGALIGWHWVLFFASARLGTASMCLAAMPTVLLWSSIFEPIIDGTRRWRITELIVGVVMVGAVGLIYNVEFRYSWGFTIGLASAAFAAAFTVLNKQLVPRHPFSVLLVWEMVGACVVCLLTLPFVEGRWLPMLPDSKDCGWLLVLALVCTVAAYAGYIDVMRRLSVFTINVVYNLEPVYGIVLAALVFGGSELMSTGFYSGTAIIVGSVVALPFMKKSP